MRKTLLISLAALAMAVAPPLSAQSVPGARGDEPVAVPRSIKQGIDFVYVDPKMSSVANKRQRPRNWLGRLLNPEAKMRGSPNPIFVELANGLQRYEASWGRLPQVKVPAGAALKSGSTGKRVAALRTRLGLPAAGGYDAALTQRVSAYQQVHGLGKPDGIAGRRTIESLNKGALYYSRLIAINMERAWRLPQMRAFDRYVVVNSGSAEAYLFERDRKADEMRVIVGADETKTPMMAVLLRDAIANPYWHVPPELVRSLTAQKVKEMGPGYFEQFHYDVLANWDPNSEKLDPWEIDWAAIRTGRQEPTMMVRQQPGPWNSMGRMKFEMPNDFGIYLHDTPHKEKFALADRWVSNGCVRLEDYRRFASWVFPVAPQPSSAPEQRIDLPRPVPVYMTYLTVDASGNGVTFRPDPYGFDALAMPQMFGGNVQLDEA